MAKAPSPLRSCIKGFFAKGTIFSWGGGKHFIQPRLLESCGQARKDTSLRLTDLSAWSHGTPEIVKYYQLDGKANPVNIFKPNKTKIKDMVNAGKYFNASYVEYHFLANTCCINYGTKSGGRIFDCTSAVILLDRSSENLVCFPYLQPLN